MSKGNGTHRPPIPVTVLTGFLGAGKTTLVNRLLTDDHSLRLGVIVNEFGEIGIDGDLIVSTEESVIEVANGCVCCTVRDDLGAALREIASTEPPVEHIVIETTGLAAPGPVIQTFFVDDELREDFELDGIVTVVDSKTVALHLADSAEARDQIAFADVIVLNKADLVSPSCLRALEDELRVINGMARMQCAEQASIDVRDVLDVGGFDLDRALDVRPELLADDAHASHDALVSSVAFEFPGELSGPRFYGWMRDLLLLKWRDLYRMKGIIALQGHEERIAFQGVHMLVDMRPAGPWGESERGSRIVFIGRDLHRGALERGLLACRVGAEDPEGAAGPMQLAGR